MKNIETLNYIKSSLDQKRSKEEIYMELLKQGEKVKAIEEAFKSIGRETSKESTQKRTIKIIVTIGTILIAAGIFSFIASNWQLMPRLLKISIILAAMLGAYGAGWILKVKSGLEKSSDALILLGSLIYGAGIFLVGQMFHLPANWPDGFILWMVGVIVMGFALDLSSLYVLAIILGIVAIIGHPFNLFEGFGFDKFLFTSSLLLVLATVITFLAAKEVREKIPSKLKDLY